MQKPKVLTGKTPTITLIRSNEYDDYLKDIHCVNCGGILFQSYSSAHMIIPGAKDRKTGQADQKTAVLLCKNNHNVTNEAGKRIQTRCNTRYLIV